MRMRTLTAAALLAMSPYISSSETLFGVAFEKEQFWLVRFDSESLGTIDYQVSLPGPEEPYALDSRPATGELYAIQIIEPFGGNLWTGFLYRLDPTTGQATQVGSAFVLPETGGLDVGLDVGVDFDPVLDELRLVDHGGGNYRLDPLTAELTPLTPLNPTAAVAGLAVEGASGGLTPTTYAVDLTTENLIQIGGQHGLPPADSGLVTVIGPLGLSLASFVSFDISASGIAYAAAVPSQSSDARGPLSSHLYRVDLATGAAKDLGIIGPEPGLAMFALAAAREPTGVSPVVVPALGRSGIVVSVLALASISLLLLRRRALEAQTQGLRSKGRLVS